VAHHHPQWRGCASDGACWRWSRSGSWSCSSLGRWRRSSGGFSSGGVATALADGETWKLAGFTIAQAAASPMLAVLAGLPVAFLLARVCCGVSRWSARWCWCRSCCRRLLSGWLSGRSRRTAGSRRSCWSTRSSTWPCWRGPSRGSGHISILVRSARHARWAPRRGGRSARPRCRRWHLLSLTQRPWCSCSAPHFGVVVILGGAAYRTLETEIYLRMVNLLNLSGAAAVARPVRRGGGCPRRRRGGTQAPGNRTAPALRFGNRPQAGTRRVVGRRRRMCGAGPAARADHRTGGQVRVHIGWLGFAG
jgi:hypothetical protein